MVDRVLLVAIHGSQAGRGPRRVVRPAGPAGVVGRRDQRAVSARFFASDAAIAPTDLDQWGPELGTKAFDSEPDTVTSAIPTVPATHMLVLLNEIGPDDACSDTHPYRGRLGEITLVG
jgi:hypothetical protein